MKQCVVCTENGKYKCPTCLVYYCSAACCKKHREQNCDVVKPENECNTKTEQKDAVRDRSFSTKDTVPLEKLESLRHCSKLKDLLSNPYLKDMLRFIDKTQNPEDVMDKAMQEPLFVEFADAVLEIVDREESVNC